MFRWVLAKDSRRLDLMEIYVGPFGRLGKAAEALGKKVLSCNPWIALAAMPCTAMSATLECHMCRFCALARSTGRTSTTHISQHSIVSFIL